MRCKNCKDKFEAIHFNQKYCSKPECMEVWIAKAKATQWKVKKRRMKAELKTTSDFVKEAQKWVNKFVRLRDKDKGCISCGSALIGKYDAGHFFSAGGHGSIRFDVRNIHAQCVKCNQWEHGNLYQYHKELLKRIGSEEFQRLENKSNGVRKFDKDELKEIIKLYKQKCKEIENNS
tara:strand:- start:926 stop:1453 length:528 start_codon:yes stop_codon:yes gene_type:complete